MEEKQIFNKTERSAIKASKNKLTSSNKGHKRSINPRKEALEIGKACTKKS